MEWARILLLALVVLTGCQSTEHEPVAATRAALGIDASTADASSAGAGTAASKIRIVILGSLNHSCG